MSFCFLYNVVSEKHSVQKIPLARGVWCVCVCGGGGGGGVGVRGEWGSIAGQGSKITC